MSDIAQEFAMSMYASTADRNAAMLAEIERLRETQHKFGQVQHDLLTQIDALREALELIAAPMRPDGTWNRERLACQQIAAQALASRKGTT